MAAATGTDARGEEIVAGLQARIAAVAERAAQATTRPRVLHLEWAEPVMCGGHWVPEMIDMAGGVNCFGDKETGSFRLDWEAVVASQPEMIILMLCGYTAQRALEDLPSLAAKPGWDDLPAVRCGLTAPWHGSARASPWGKAQQAWLGLDYTLGMDKQSLRSVAAPTSRALGVERALATCIGEVVGGPALLATQLS